MSKLNRQMKDEEWKKEQTILETVVEDIVRS